MLVGNILENPRKYPEFDFKPLKNTRIAILRAVLGKIRLQSPKIFQKTLKNTKITILYPKKYDEHTYHFTMEVPPPPPGGVIVSSFRHAGNRLIARDRSNSFHC